MRPKLIRETLLAGLAIVLVVPALKAPAFTGPATISSNQSVPSATHNSLAVDGPRNPRPLEAWNCISSWYGEEFDGQLTANGELYDMYAQTAAHPTLPLGSVVRIEDLRTHKSAVVRINDRGPYVAGRGLDVSYQVAKELGFLHSGLARVRLEVLEVPTSKTQHPAN